MQRPDSRQCLPCRLTKNPNSCLILVCSSTSSMTRYPCLPEQEEAIYSGQVTRKTYMYRKFHILAAATKAIKSKFLPSWDVSRCHCITPLDAKTLQFQQTLISAEKNIPPPPRRLSSSNRRSRKKTPGRWSSDNKKQDITKKPGYLATNTIYLSTHAQGKHKCKKEEEEDAPSP